MHQIQEAAIPTALTWLADGVYVSASNIIQVCVHPQTASTCYITVRIQQDEYIVDEHIPLSDVQTQLHHWVTLINHTLNITTWEDNMIWTITKIVWQGITLLAAVATPFVILLLILLYLTQ